MQDINSVVIVRNLTRDCGTDPYGRDFAYTQGGVAIATISIASNRSRKQNDGSYADEVSYFDVKLFGKTAENLKPYLTKGQKVCVEGFLKQERWQDKQSGATMSKVVILANQVQLVGGRREQDAEPPQHGQQYRQPYQRQSQAGRQEQQGYASPEPPQGADMFTEDIPF